MNKIDRDARLSEGTVDGVQDRRVYAGIDESDDGTRYRHRCGRIGPGWHRVEVEELMQAAEVSKIDHLRGREHWYIGGAVIERHSGDHHLARDHTRQRRIRSDSED